MLKDLDFAFIAKMLSKQASHLTGQRKLIEGLMEGYDKQISSLEKINDERKYGQYLKELHFKKAEALEKLSHIIPNVEKINQQIALIEQV